MNVDTVHEIREAACRDLRQRGPAGRPRQARIGEARAFIIAVSPLTASRKHPGRARRNPEVCILARATRVREARHPREAGADVVFSARARSRWPLRPKSSASSAPPPTRSIASAPASAASWPEAEDARHDDRAWRRHDSRQGGSGPPLARRRRGAARDRRPEGRDAAAPRRGRGTGGTVTLFLDQRARDATRGTSTRPRRRRYARIELGSSNVARSFEHDRSNLGQRTAPRGAPHRLRPDRRRRVPRSGAASARRHWTPRPIASAEAHRAGSIRGPRHRSLQPRPDGPAAARSAAPNPS